MSPTFVFITKLLQSKRGLTTRKFFAIQSRHRPPHAGRRNRSFIVANTWPKRKEEEEEKKKGLSARFKYFHLESWPQYRQISY